MMVVVVVGLEGVETQHTHTHTANKMNATAYIFMTIGLVLSGLGCLCIGAVGGAFFYSRTNTSMLPRVPPPPPSQPNEDGLPPKKRKTAAQSFLALLPELSRKQP